MMPIPQLPSDNLYKYCGTGGVILLLVLIHSILNPSTTASQYLIYYQSFGFAIGACLTVWGFRQWYIKLQKHQDDIILSELDFQKNRKSDRATHIHKMQFEQERSLYQELWKQLRATEGYLSTIVYADYGTAEKPGQEEVDLCSLDKALNDINELIMDTYPFFVKSVHNHAIECLSICMSALHAQRQRDRKEVVDCSGELGLLIRNTGEAIRDRLETVRST